mmetsp:Transcript_60275/g.111785  ORF Transcript_60275/g.111785 Transcript_60275/m.111785 type:complete len:502 (+) Transcript_60275:95-1600(+)
MAPQDMEYFQQCQGEPAAQNALAVPIQPAMPCSHVNASSWPVTVVGQPMLVDPSYVGYTAVWACPAPVPACEMWPADGCFQAVPVHNVMQDGQSVAYAPAAMQPMWEAPSMQVAPTFTSGWVDARPFATVETATTQAHSDECAGDLAAAEPYTCPADMLAARVAQDACCSIDVEQQSVAISSCSTAPSVVQKRRRKPRAPPAQRKADAERHREAELLAQELLQTPNELSARLKAGGAKASAALAQMSGATWRMSLDSVGCRIVQDAVAVAKGSERAELVKDLHGHVREGMGSPHANYVLQKVVEVMPIEIASFVAEELAGITADACRHRYGCRIVCRLIEQFARSECVVKLMDEMMKDMADLARHSFGHHVMQAVLEHGADKYKQAIAKELAKDILANATNRNGTFVIERALFNCESKDASMLLHLLAEDDVLDDLIVNQFGIFIAKTLLQNAPKPMVDGIWEKVNSAPEDVRGNKHFQKLLEQLAEDEKECAASDNGEDY